MKAALVMALLWTGLLLSPGAGAQNDPASKDAAEVERLAPLHRTSLLVADLDGARAEAVADRLGGSAVPLAGAIGRGAPVTICAGYGMQRWSNGGQAMRAILALLATIGSTSPYVGLFGTVWGIMVAFMQIGSAQTATLAVVAPPIAEALIATAMGLFAAIPAVVAYNRYANAVQRLENRYDDFAEEFSNILQRQAHVRGRK